MTAFVTFYYKNAPFVQNVHTKNMVILEQSLIAIIAGKLFIIW